MLRISWCSFLFGGVALYLAANAGFALLYLLQPGAIGNARPGSFADAFFFSVQTIATIGYGQLVPATLYANLVVTIETATGLMFLALATGLVFARFSRPTARILFSRVAVINHYNGVPTLMLRVANQRQSYILEAAASLVLVRDEETADGHSLTRFHDLKLERSRSPMFALSWQIMHRIDESSPLHGVTTQDIREADMRLAVTLSGVDETFAAGITARHTYAHEDILFERRFVDIFSDGDHPRHLYVDLGRFHDHEAVRVPGDEANA
jgi:inward rectifier potassium channel